MSRTWRSWAGAYGMFDVRFWACVTDTSNRKANAALMIFPLLKQLTKEPKNRPTIGVAQSWTILLGSESTGCDSLNRSTWGQVFSFLFWWSFDVTSTWTIAKRENKRPAPGMPVYCVRRWSWLPFRCASNFDE